MCSDSAYASGGIKYNRDQAYLDELLSQTSLGTFFKKRLYEIEKTQDSIIIGKGDIDAINDEFCNLFEVLAPFVEADSYINIEGEEEQYLNFTFDGNGVSNDGDAY